MPDEPPPPTQPDPPAPHRHDAQAPPTTPSPPRREPGLSSFAISRSRTRNLHAYRRRQTRVRLTAAFTLLGVCLLPLIAVQILLITQPAYSPATPAQMPRTYSLFNALSGFTCCAPPLAFLAFWVWLALDRIYAGITARECDYICCGNCLHDLRGLADIGQCPECGEHYNTPELIAAWKEIDGVPEP